MYHRVFKKGPSRLFLSLFTGQHLNLLLIFFILSNFFIGCQDFNTKEIIHAVIVRAILEILFVWVILKGIFLLAQWLKKKSQIRKERYANDLARLIAKSLNGLNNHRPKRNHKVKKTR